jgi:ATP-dependent exoDNAse (exonuclease V) beta subunit
MNNDIERIIRVVNEYYSEKHGVLFDVRDKTRKRTHADARRVAAMLMMDYLPDSNDLSKHAIIADAMKRERSTVYHMVSSFRILYSHDKEIQESYHKLKQKIDILGFEDSVDYIYRSIEEFNSRIEHLIAQLDEQKKQININVAELNSLVEAYTGASDKGSVPVQEEARVRED